MLDSALKGYSEVGGAHLPMDTFILNKAAETQMFYANRFERSGDLLQPSRVGMYPREAAHIGFMTGVQQGMRERGAKFWRRILHPELSKTGPCPQCTADAELVHPIDMPFFEPHPLGVCGLQGVMFETANGGVEIPVPGESPQGFIEHVKQLFKNIQSRVRRIRR